MRGVLSMIIVFFFQAEDGIRDLVRSRGLGDVYKRQIFCKKNIKIHIKLAAVNTGVKKLPFHLPIIPRLLAFINLIISCTTDIVPKSISTLAIACDTFNPCLLYTSPSPRDRTRYRMPSSA